MCSDYDLINSLLGYEPETGRFFWKKDRRMGKTGKGILIAEAGCDAGGVASDTGYVQIMIAKKKRFGHRIAFLLMTGFWPVGQVDHINGVRSDNRWKNLRDVPKLVNAQNLRSARVDSKLGVMGVQFHKKSEKYVSRITANGRKIILGYFDCAEKAGTAYLKAKRILHSGCTI